MKTSQLIALSAAIVACAAPVASASPILDPPARNSAVAAGVVQSGPSGSAAHHEQIAIEQWQRRQPQRGATLLVDRTGTDDGPPVILIGAVVLSVLLALLLMQVAGKGLVFRRRPRAAG